MKLFNAIILSLAGSALALDNTSGLRRRASEITAQLESKAEDHDMATLNNMVKVKVTNQAYQQPFGAFFVMTHNDQNAPLFKVGEGASDALATLAEDGNPAQLVEAYNVSSNVGYVAAKTKGAPYFGGESLEFMVPYDMNYPYLTIASMAINTNDCFVALNGVKLEPDAVHQAPGYDSGTEENNEKCSSIPGPACDGDTGNERSLNGEGFVHVHRGFFGIGGELSAAGYDWRNPMMRVEMSM